MRILVDLTHPADFHLFRHAVETWRGRGHEVILTARDKDLTLDLLDAVGWDRIELGQQGSGLVGLGLEMVGRQARLLALLRRRRPDVVTAMSGAFVGPPARLLGIPCVAWTDTEHATLQNRIGFPPSAAVVTPACYTGPVPPQKHLTYRGYHELAYLRPERFTPDPDAVRAFGLEPGQPFSFVRLVSWKAHHDVGASGLDDLRRVIDSLRRDGEVVLSSERPLDDDLGALVVRGGFDRVHHLLAFARMVVAESGTMVSEAAVLGTPSIFANTCRLGYLADLEQRFGLVRCFHDPPTMLPRTLETIEQWRNDPELTDRCRNARHAMLEQTQDVTRVVVETVEAYGRGARWPAGPIEWDAG